MNKSTIALFFTIFFTIMIVTPSIMSMADGNADIVEMIDAGDEEEQESHEYAKDSEVKILQNFNNNIVLLNCFITKELEFYFNSYISKDLELCSPPPEQV